MESVSAVESIIALPEAGPFSRRAARRQSSVDAPIADVPLAPIVEPAVAELSVETAVDDVVDVPIVTDKIEQLIEDAESDPDVESCAMTDPTAEPPADNTDAFDRACRAFRDTGAVPPASETGGATVDPAESDRAAALVHIAPRRRRNVRKLLTVGATVGVMSLAGLLAVSMTLPAEAVAAAQGSTVAATSLVTASSVDDKAAGAEIQAFVAPSGVENGSLARADDFSTISLVEVAAEQGINYSNEVFTNDPEAAIQWPFLVGVGMSYGYGMRSGRLHEGIDFVPGDGAPAQAIADGTVRIATEQGGAYGVTVYIDHVIDGQVITSHYSHMQYGSLQVKAGDTVKVGDIVGKTGNTGRSYGAHMHFELIVNNSTIDPLPWLQKNAGRQSY